MLASPAPSTAAGASAADSGGGARGAGRPPTRACRGSRAEEEVGLVAGAERSAGRSAGVIVWPAAQMLVVGAPGGEGSGRFDLLETQRQLRIDHRYEPVDPIVGEPGGPDGCPGELAGERFHGVPAKKGARRSGGYVCGPDLVAACKLHRPDRAGGAGCGAVAVGALAAHLQQVGADAFVASWDELIENIGHKTRALTAA